MNSVIISFNINKSIQLGGIVTFWSIRTFWLKIVHEELVSFKKSF